MVADLEAGAASIDLNLPQGVGLRLRLKSVGTLENRRECLVPVRAEFINPQIMIRRSIVPG